MRRLAPVVVVALASTTPVRADELQARIVATARATVRDSHGFTRTLVIERSGAERKSFIDVFDPRRPAGQRWTTTAVDGRAPTAKEAERARKAKRAPAPSYAELAEWFGAPATRVAGPAGAVIYRFARLPKGAAKLGSYDASEHTQAEALVNVQGPVPFVERVRFTSTTPFRMFMVAKVERFTYLRSYHRLPNGTMVVTGSNSALAGSMMGKAGQMRTTATFTDFR